MTQAATETLLLDAPLSNYVIDYMQPRSKRIPAETLKQAGDLAKIMEREDKVKVLGVYTVAEWDAKERAKAQGTSHG